MSFHRVVAGRRAPRLVLLLPLLAGLGAVRPLRAPGDELEGLLPLSLTPGGTPFVTAIGSATSQGVAVLKADEARSIFGVTGAGIRLGVISDSFNGANSTPTLATQIAAGNLPGTGNPNGHTTAVTVVKDATGSDEGRAMLEIVHDVAPAARLYFHSAFNNTQAPGSTSAATATPDQTIADAIAGLAGVSGMRIIVDDVGIVTAPRFQDGAAARAANAAFAQGIAYFSAAGNSATDATRVTTTAGVNGTVNWGTDDLLRMRIAANSTGRVAVHWGEPYPSVSGTAATSDFRVAATDTAGSVTYFNVNGQAAGADPYEFFSVTNSNAVAIDFALRVTRNSGTAPVVMQLSTFGSVLAITDADKTNAPTIYGQAAASGAVAVAASYWGTPTAVESFSSRGSSLVLFDSLGNRIDETRATPQLTAPDGGTTTTAGFAAFYGTSAAAPHAAAVAALVLERFDQKGLTVSTRDLYQVLFDSAVDIGTAGFDSASGHGRIDALAAVAAGRIWDGNGSAAGLSGTGAWSHAKWTLEAAGDKPTGRFIRGQPAVFGTGTAAASSYAVSVDGAYDVAGLSFTRDTVALTAGGGTLRLTAAAVDVEAGITATIAAPLTGTVGLAKQGAGTLRLTGSSSVGTTTVGGGLLAIDGLLSGDVVVTAAGRLGGSGTIGGGVTLGGTHAPGNSPGLATVGGSLAYQAGAVVAWELAANTATQGPVGGRTFDQIVVGGDLAFTGSTMLTLAFVASGSDGSWPSTVDWTDDFWNANRSWTLWQVTGSTSGFANLGLAAGSWLDSQGTAFAAVEPGRSFSLALDGQDVLLVYAVPEPSAIALAVVGLFGGWWRARRGRRRGGGGYRSGSA